NRNQYNRAAYKHEKLQRRPPAPSQLPNDDTNRGQSEKECARSKERSRVKYDRTRYMNIDAQFSVTDDCKRYEGNRKETDYSAPFGQGWTGRWHHQAFGIQEQLKSEHGAERDTQRPQLSSLSLVNIS